ncbi:MAG TPA: hypothetical protein VM820_11995 [Vicinamibacterales bacterium]|jgi:hypothetical protein|nr:hypothetical protein [Vicinamibacterales bacterium]
MGGAGGLARTTAVVCGLLTVLSAILWPGRWRVPGGVLGGGALVGLSAWAIRGVVDGWLSDGGGRPGGAWLLVKFFTRHGILALAAYGMMARLHLDPVAMLVGVSSLVIAAGIDALRRIQRFS